MLSSMDMRTVMFSGALISLTIAGIMVYYSCARKTYPGFSHWCLGFVSVGCGAALIALRGVLPDFMTIVLSNFLVVLLPFMLTKGMVQFLDVKWDKKIFHFLTFLFFVTGFVWGTYVDPNVYIRIIIFNIVFLALFVEVLYLSVRFIPSVLGNHNWLLLGMLCFAIVSALLRLAVTWSEGKTCTFLICSDGGQCLMILMTILSVVGIMNSLIILNVHRMENDLTEANRRIENLANRDGLTGLYNRRYFDLMLEKEFRRLRRNAKPLSLIMADIDFFKNYNDAYGHQAGDDCIRFVADVFEKNSGRTSDISARYGGEEFAMILPDTDSSGARKVATKIGNSIRELEIPHSASLVDNVVTLSMGVATVVPEMGKTSDLVVEIADNALYESKRNGRNQIRCYFEKERVC